jgi:hypothetical protein
VIVTAEKDKNYLQYLDKIGYTQTPIEITGYKGDTKKLR